MIRTALVRERGFRPEVFAAEDQEWASWLFREKGRRIARISGGGLINRNPCRFSYQKAMNEYLAIACFIRPELLELPNLARLALSVLAPPGNFFSLKERRFRLALLRKLVACRRGAVKGQPCYF